ncbi:hypothetical protein AWB80_02886 [Caballeronia pedi]|uniref:DUF3168 domain-containing protein n=1 Tax=Caballeronia pedi TaxID=1777141 RepID=A0A158B0T7_9BURK|nr:DUF3168 domain-containing protein [Caballeronia pedi]SAK63589.1 hypothetical protein AWB80_02886 [Caballeronia pedi]
MTEADLFAILDSAMPGRVFTPIAPKGTVEPYVIYQDVTVLPTNTMCGYAWLDQCHWQIDSYARTKGEARANMELVKQALHAADPQPTVENEQSLYEVETRLCRRMVQVITWDSTGKVTA